MNKLWAMLQQNIWLRLAGYLVLTILLYFLAKGIGGKVFIGLFIIILYGGLVWVFLGSKDEKTKPANEQKEE